MTQPVQRGRPRSNRRREMLLAASEEFANAAFSEAKMQAIADAAGVTKATLYAHFGDKEQLYRAVTDFLVTELPEPELYHLNGDRRNRPASTLS